MKHYRDRNIYLCALFATMLFCASFHLILLAIFAISHSQPAILNLFNILDLDLFFPSIGIGSLSAVLAILTTLAIYLVALAIIKRQPKPDLKKQSNHKAEQ